MANTLIVQVEDVRIVDCGYSDRYVIEVQNEDALGAPCWTTDKETNGDDVVVILAKRVQALEAALKSK